MSRVILFDVNETLLDLSPLRPHFERLFGDVSVMGVWFARLLHSSLVVSLTDAYDDFGALAGAALDGIAGERGVELSAEDRGAVVETMRSLPPHPDVQGSLEGLRSAGLRLATLTNSSPEMVAAQMDHSGLAEYFEQQFSVHTVRRFKPAPEAYHMAAEAMGVEPSEARLVAAHDWDVFGALRSGCRGAYIARSARPYHPLYEQPDIIGPDLLMVAAAILEKDL